jgi:hypothetical protein
MSTGAADITASAASPLVPPPATAAPVLYRSAGDGWRVGHALHVSNPTTVLVHDARTGLHENVRPGDVVDVLQVVSPAVAKTLLSSAQVHIPALDEAVADGDEEKIPQVPEPHCLTSDDLATLDPSPLLFPGTVIDAFRCRQRQSRASVSTGASEEDAAFTTFMGDNVSYTMRSVPPSGIVPIAVDGSMSDADRESSLAARVYAALTATSNPQVVLAGSDTSPYGEFCTTAVRLTQLMGADPNVASKIAAALAIAQAFTHDVHGNQHAMTQLSLLSSGQTNFPFVASQLSVSMVDVERLATRPDANWEILGFLAFALSNEEKERCYLPTRKSAKPPACVGDSTSPATVDRLRERYFVFCEALETLRFEVNLQLFVFARIAAAMHLLDVTFDEDGTVHNLTAMRNAAKLISADFNVFTKLLPTRQHCIAAASFLYMSTLRLLVAKLNSRLNEVGAQEDSQGIVNSVTLISTFAPSPSDDHHVGTAVNPMSLHDLYRHVAFEDVVQRFFVSTEIELGQWQSQGFVVPKDLQAALDPFDNYRSIKLLKAKGGILASMDTALALLFPEPEPVPEGGEGDDADGADGGDGGENADGEGGGSPSSARFDSPDRQTAPGGDDADADREAKDGDSESDDLPYFAPDRDAVAKMAYAAIPPEKETEGDRPPKKAMPPVELPVRNDQLALMAFIFAGEVTIAGDVPGTKLEMGGEYVLTIGPSGNVTFWRKEKPAWTGNVQQDFIGVHIATAFDVTIQMKPSGAKSKPIPAALRIMVRKKPDDREAHNDLMNLLVRAFLHLNPKAPCTYTPPPVAQAPIDTAEDRDAAAAEAQRAEAEAERTKSMLTDEDKARIVQREKTRQIQSIFTTLARHGGVRYDEKSHTLQVEHSFGSRCYALPPLDAITHESPAAVRGVNSWLTIQASAFEDVRQYMLNETDTETQEALTIEDQSSYVGTLSGLFRGDVDALLQNTMTRTNARYWFTFVVQAPTAKGFNGERMERHLDLCLFQPVRRLRLQLRHHYLPVLSATLLDQYLSLLPGPKRIAFRQAEKTKTRDRVYAEEICIAGHVPHVIGSSVVLLSAKSLLNLEKRLESSLRLGVGVVQRFIRQWISSAVVFRRSRSISEALARDDEERNTVITLRQWQIDNAAHHRMRRLGVQEEEFATRRAIADECWISWVALQTEVQSELEDVMQGVVARRVAQRQVAAKAAVKQSQKAAVDALTRRIQERVLQQGAGLDKLVRERLATDSASRARVEKLRRAQDMLLKTKIAREEQRTMMEDNIEQKGRRIDIVLKQREAKREAIRMDLWNRQERERVVREQIDANRALLEQQAQEEIVMDSISYHMRKRTEVELSERQRAQRDALRNEQEAERKKREDMLNAQAKRQWSTAVRRDKALERKRMEEQERLQRDRAALLRAQERERLAAEKAKEEEANRQKMLTRKLLKAHTLLYTPLLFEQSAKGETRLVTALPSGPRSARSKSAPRIRMPVGAEVDGFTMAGGAKSYSKLLPQNVWDGVIRHHESVLEREGSLSPGRSAPRSKSGRDRLRSASPRSVYSL